MMSACSMPSVNTGHGVRATQRTNALIRPIGMASVVTGQPYRAGRTRKGRCGTDVSVRSITVISMAGVFSRLVGQDAVEAELVAAAQAARGDSAHSSSSGAATGTMTHAWLITGPPGSGRSIAALCFAAALQCTSDGVPGCGECRACTTTMAGTHADVRRIIPEGLSIGVDEMRNIVQIASRRPGTGRWQIVLIEDADRLTEGAANALLKVVEEPPPSTVFLLCAPSVDPEDIAITLRSRCRHVALVTPPVDAIARVLIETDGAAGGGRPVGGVGQRRPCRPGATAGDRRAGAGAAAARPRAGARRGDAVAGLRRGRGVGGDGRGRGAGVDRRPQRGRDRGVAHGAGRGWHRQGHRGSAARRDGCDQRP